MERAKLILIMGVPASGKTTIAKMVIKQIKAVYLDNNFIADSFFPHTRVDKRYKKIRQSIYKSLYRITRENLILGNSVVLDVPHVTHMKDKKWRFEICKLANDANAEFKIIRCYCSKETLKKRIIERDEERDNWKLIHWEEFLKKEPILVEVPFDHMDINTEENTEENIKNFLEYFSS